MSNDFYWTLGSVLKLTGQTGNTVVGVDSITNGSVGNTSGLTKFDKTHSSVAYITSDYNTGYMTGDIRGAWCVDKDVTSLSGTVINDSTSDWDNNGNSTWTITTAEDFSIDNSGTSNYGRLTLTGLNGSKHYIVTANVTAVSDNVGFYSDGLDYLVSNTGLVSVTYTGITRFDLYVWANDSATITDLQIKEAVPDRSVKGNGLAVYGTPTVSAVATGAELKYVGGWGGSSANSLRAPNWDGLAVGTGELSISFWYYTPSVGSASSAIFDWADDDLGVRMYLWDYGANYEFMLRDAAPSHQYIRGISAKTGWSHITMMRDSAGTMRMFYDGAEITPSSGLNYNNGTKKDLGSTGRNLYIGCRHSVTHGLPDNRAIALPRISATAPTAEQIKEIYEAEKPLFQENAKCTLNGSSDAVTALAYDDSTELLHIGTSGGRSTFQGLRRVDETTNNTTEIAAQGGLIVEETA